MMILLAVLASTLRQGTATSRFNDLNIKINGQTVHASDQAQYKQEMAKLEQAWTDAVHRGQPADVCTEEVRELGVKIGMDALQRGAPYAEVDAEMERLLRAIDTAHRKENAKLWQEEQRARCEQEVVKLLREGEEAVAKDPSKRKEIMREVKNLTRGINREYNRRCDLKDLRDAAEDALLRGAPLAEVNEEYEGLRKALEAEIERQRRLDQDDDQTDLDDDAEDNLYTISECDEGNECLICMDKPITYLCSPCGHPSRCTDCALNEDLPKTCGLCRAPVTGMIRKA